MAGLFDKPKPPDPLQTSQTQQGFNVGSGVAQQNLNMVNQDTPFGSIDYMPIGVNPDGTPRYQATTKLSAPEQALFNTQVGNQLQLGGMFPGMLGALSPLPASVGGAANVLGNYAGQGANASNALSSFQNYAPGVAGALGGITGAGASMAPLLAGIAGTAGAGIAPLAGVAQSAPGAAGALGNIAGTTGAFANPLASMSGMLSPGAMQRDLGSVRGNLAGIQGAANQMINPFGVNADIAGAQGAIAQGRQGLSNLAQQYAGTPDLGIDATTNRIMGWGQNYLDPIFNRQQQSLEGQLQSQGMDPRNEAYRNAMRDFETARGNTYSQLLMQAEPTAFNQAVQQYQLPLQTQGQIAQMQLGSAAPGLAAAGTGLQAFQPAMQGLQTGLGLGQADISGMGMGLQAAGLGTNAANQLLGQGVGAAQGIGNMALGAGQGLMGSGLNAAGQMISPVQQQAAQGLQGAQGIINPSMGMLGTMMGGMSQPMTQMPGMINTPQTQVQTPNYMNAVQQNYNQQLAQQQAMLNGIFGIGSAIGGGWARGGGIQKLFGGSGGGGGW